MLEEQKLSVIFDAELQRALGSLLDHFQTVAVAPSDVTVSIDKFKPAVIRFAQSSFLSREVIEKRVLEPFFVMHPNAAAEWNEEEFLNCLHVFYNNERISIVRLAGWLLATAASSKSTEILTFCRAMLKSLIDGGLAGKAALQLQNLSSISLPSTILKENRPDFIYAWIHQNILEQRELAKLVFGLVNCDFLKLDVEDLFKILSQLLKGNFGLAGAQRFNLDAETAAAAQEAFYYRQGAAIRILGLKSLLSSSVSPQVIISTLNPLKTDHLLKIKESFKIELPGEHSNAFKFSWALLVGYMELLEVLNHTELRYEYLKVAASTIDSGVFKSIIEWISNTGDAFKDLFKDVFTCFFTVFDLDQAAVHVPMITECLIHIFTGQPRLAEEFWYVDSQYAGRTAIIKFWVNRFPHEYLPLVRLMTALASGPASAQIVAEFLLKGFDRMFVERSSDRGQVVEEYDLASEVYNLITSARFEIKSHGISFILEPETRGVMGSAFNERPMVHWTVPISCFHFLLRVLQSGRCDDTSFYCILDLIEKLLVNSSDFAPKLLNHLEATAPLFSASKVPNLPETVISAMTEMISGQKGILLAKCMDIISGLEPVLLESESLLELLREGNSEIMDGLTLILKQNIVEVGPDAFALLKSILKFAECVINCVEEDDVAIIQSLQGTIFSHIVDRIGAWRFVDGKHRISLLAEVCRLVLTLDKVSPEANNSISKNLSLLTAICLLIADMTQGDTRELLESGVDFSVFFMCLSTAIASAGNDALSLAEFFSSPHLFTPEGQKSPLTIIASAIKRPFLSLPVLLFFQYVLQSESFALNCCMNHESLDLIGDSCKAVLSTAPTTSLHFKLRSAALAVLNNAACIRGDIFLYLYSRADDCLLKLFTECVTGSKEDSFNHELMLITGIIAVIWSAVADFTVVINALKRKSSSFIVDLASLLSRNWTDARASMALKTIGSVCEVLAVELCYFNCTAKIPNPHLASSLAAFDPETFLSKFSRLRNELPDDFEVFCESFILFANSLISLPGEGALASKFMRGLVDLICQSGTLNTEMYRVVGYGLLLHRPVTEVPVLLGHRHFEALLNHLLQSDFAEVPTTASELLGTLLASNPTLTMPQQQQLLKVSQAVLDRLRHAVIANAKEKPSALLVLLFESLRLGLKTNMPDMIHFMRREAALKTAFRLIRNFYDCESLATFTSAALEVETLLEEFVSGDLMESFIESGSLVNEDFFSQFLSLLCAVKVNFTTISVMSERISTVLYGANLKALLLDPIRAPEVLFSLLQLLACNLETPIEVPATEAFLAGLIEDLFKLLSKAYTSEQFKTCELIVKTLASFSNFGKAKFATRRGLQSQLFPPLEDSPMNSPIVATLIAFSAKSNDAKENVNLILKSNCPERLMQSLLKLVK